MSTEHVCDPEFMCPPWMHPYASADEIARRQQATAAKLAQIKATERRTEHPIRPQPAVASRVVDDVLTKLEDLAQRGYVFTTLQEWRFRRLAWSVVFDFSAEDWKRSPLPPTTNEDEINEAFQRITEHFRYRELGEGDPS